MATVCTINSCPVLMKTSLKLEALLPADGLHNTMCQSKFRSLLQNSVGRRCTTNTEQIEVMELQRYSHQRAINFLWPS